MTPICIHNEMKEERRHLDKKINVLTVQFGWEGSTNIGGTLFWPLFHLACHFEVIQRICKRKIALFLNRKLASRKLISVSPVF